MGVSRRHEVVPQTREAGLGAGAVRALVLQLALSFGHFHAQAASASPAPASLSDTAVFGDPTDQTADATQQSPGSQDPDQQPTDSCAICAVMAMAGAALVSPPLLLLLPQAVEFLYLAADAEFIHLKSVGTAFQPRAPPAS